MLTVKELYKGKWLLSERKKSHFLVIKHFSLELHVIWDESLTSVRVTSVHSATDVCGLAACGVHSCVCPSVDGLRVWAAHCPRLDVS